MKIRLGYISNSSSSSFIAGPEEVARILRETRLEKLGKIQKVVNNEKNIVSLHDEIFKKSK